MTDVVHGNVAGEEPGARDDAGAPIAIQPGTSRLLVKTFAGGPLAAFGHDLTFVVPIRSGELRFDADQLRGSVGVRILADAIALQGGKSEKDRRDIERTLKDRVLEVMKFREITFESREVRVRRANAGYDADVAGSLTLHGVTRPLDLKAKLTRTGPLVRAFGDFALRLSDFAIEQVTVAGGALKVKDEIKATFDITAR